MSGLHVDALSCLTTWHAPTPAQETLRAAYVDHLRAHPDGLDRSCRPDHVTASTLVLSPDGDQVLLTHHAKARAWFQFGGHVEPSDLTLSGAALREVTEESGLTTLELDPEPVHLDTHEVPFCGGTGTRHLDVRFLAIADPKDGAHTVSEESTDVRWWPVSALPSDEASLHELIDLGRRRLARRPRRR